MEMTNMQKGRRGRMQDRRARTTVGICTPRQVACMCVHGVCPHGGLVHVYCILERAASTARGQADPMVCVTCRSVWARRN